VQPSRMLLWKKMCNSKWPPRHGCDSGLNTNSNNSGEFIAFSTFLYDLAPNSPELLLLKFLHLAYHHRYFLAATLDCIKSFFTGGRTLFLQLGCFGLDFTSFCNSILCTRVGQYFNIIAPTQYYDVQYWVPQLFWRYRNTISVQYYCIF